ncbi:MAG: hypothetical protein J5830_03095 [Clostridia bacterium]|nr:hypothetical protein [Clostridia bacterium]
MKNFLRIFLIFAALTLVFSACTPFTKGGSATEQYVTYYVSDLGTRAYARDFFWNGDVDETDIVIPDKLESGAVVEGIGGYFGTGVPDPFSVIVPKEVMPLRGPSEDDEITKVTFNVTVGKNVKRAMFGYAEYGGKYLLLGTGDDPEWYEPVFVFSCDPDNPYLKSVDGKLYEKETGELVECRFYPDGE